jgi:hypothetical protein
MGIIRQGVLGGFRKKTGSVVGAYHRGQDTIRGLPRVSNKPPTQAQLDQRFKFGMITSFLSWISNLVDIGFGTTTNIPTPMNKAVSYHLKNAITGVSPNFVIDFTKVKYSSGKLALPPGLQIAMATAAKVNFEWTDDGIDTKFKDATDMANVMVYNPTTKQFVTLGNAGPRSAEGYVLQLPLDFSGEEVHCYISFSSVINKQLVSNSFYLGLFEVL